MGAGSVPRGRSEGAAVAFVFVAASLNAVWSYAAMHIGMFAAPAPTDAIGIGTYAFYCAYALFGLAIAVVPKPFERLESSGGWYVALGFAMVLATSLAAFSFGQSVFDRQVLWVVGSAAVALAHTMAMLALYALVFRVCPPVLAAVAVVGTHIVKLLASTCLAGAGSGTAVVAMAMVMPLAFAACLWAAHRCACAGRPVRVCRGAMVPERAGWVLFTLLYLGTVGADWIAGLDLWLVSDTDRLASSSPVTAAWVVFEAFVAATLAWLTVRGCVGGLHGSDAPALARLCGRVGFVLLVGYLASCAVASGATPPALAHTLVDRFVAAVSVYGHGVFLVVLFELARTSRIPFMRLYGAWVVLFAVLSLGRTAVCVYAPGATGPVVVLLFAAPLCALAVVAGAPGPLRAPETEGTLFEDGDIAGPLAQRCRVLAAQYGLTTREEDVVFLLAQGRTRQVMGEMLGVSEGTVKTHTSHAYVKLGIGSQQELIDIVYGKDVAL